MMVWLFIQHVWNFFILHNKSTHYGHSENERKRPGDLRALDHASKVSGHLIGFV
jgi:hypothetical protein